MKYFFPIHLDGGNRGCEAIAKGSALLINEDKENLFGYCRDVKLDTHLGVDKFFSLIPAKRDSYVIDRCLGLLNKIFHSKKTKAWRELYPYRSFLRLIHSDDVMISTGGDMMCYDDNVAVYTNIYLHRKGVKTVLWGCSMGPENLTSAKLMSLFNFSLIYARESLTYEYFKQLGLKNICLCPDPAFILPAEEFPLQECFQKDNVVGLNISNFVVGGMSLESDFGKEITELIGYILNYTEYDILLVPHVTWNRDRVNQDDRQMARIIKSCFGNDERISILDIDNMNYCQIRYVISKCKMFIGARTHAVISAYAMCVPTIALGYSIKSRGIAKDLGLDEALVVNSKNFIKGSLLQSFNYLKEHENEIRQHLSEIMPVYKQRTYLIREHLALLNTR